MTASLKIPGELIRRDTWVARDYHKVPLDPHTGSNASAADPTTWGSLRDALALCRRSRRAVGVSFVLTRESGIVGGDLDHVRDRESGELMAQARQIVAMLDTYAEVSPSGTGLRFFAFGTLPAHGRKRGDFEIYDDARALSVTGHHLAGTPRTVEHRDAELRRLHLDVFGPPPAPPPPRSVIASAERLDDRDVIELASTARNGAAFRQLFDGDTSDYGSHSEADLALCSRLAFWTGGDAAQVDALFRASGLMRAKWDARHGAGTYGQRTIAKALSGAREFYSPRRRESYAVTVAVH